MRRGRSLLMAVTLVLAGATTAGADATVFIGASTTPDSRRVQGISAGAGLLLFAFELEYASTAQSDNPGDTPAPALKTGMANVVVQAPFAIFGFQPYATAGGGVFKETLGRREETGFGSNVGGGVKISLAGPLRLRIDYRVFRLGSDALYSPAHRFYAGLNLRF
ncbi:MAG: outer membrane beta-barrel protein [Luteitalea sp.]|nr:outer membrane beta-barrel protein [Luteitalea sp.]